VWTVDDPGRVAELTDWGVDGIVTNRPGVALAVIDGRRDGTWVDG
jgi:glycerophosphoryl diester phosphodiesterase